jgi:hypothetical protein
MRPGTRLRSWAGYVCSPATMERLIDPVLADLQYEHEGACATGQPRHRRWIRINGYLAFWRVLLLHVPIAYTRQTVRKLAGADDWSVGRALGAAAVTMLIMTGLLIAVPLQNLAERDMASTWPAILVLPQALPLSLPFSILVGVLSGLRGRTVTNRARRAVMVVGLAGSLGSLGMIIWVMPAANDAFRSTMTGRQVQKGFDEISVRVLREKALAIKNDGQLGWAGMLLLSYHSRWALGGAALVFAVFGLGVNALRLGVAPTAAVGASGCIVYLAYFFELALVPRSVFSDERLAFGLVWLPNIVMIVTGLAFMSGRDGRRALSGER